MKRSEVVAIIEGLKEKLAYLGSECVDDPEEIMTDLGVGSKEYVEALEDCLVMLQDDPPGPDA
jgi:hypothetical protein